MKLSLRIENPTGDFHHHANPRESSRSVEKIIQTETKITPDIDFKSIFDALKED